MYKFKRLEDCRTPDDWSGNDWSNTWAVIREDFDGAWSTVAHFRHRRDAAGFCRIMNAAATVETV